MTMKKRLLLILVVVFVLALMTSAAFAQSEPVTEVDFLSEILGLLTGLVGWLLEQLRLFFEAIFSGIQALINLIGDLLNGLLSAIQAVLYWLGDAISFIVTLIGDTVQFFVLVIRAIFDFIIWAIRNIVEVIEILGLILQIVIGLIRLALSWAVQVFFIMRGIFEVLQGATPTAIPGLPQCVTAPLDHDLCALWYIMEFTFFDGTWGNAILAFAILAIDLWIIFYAVRKVIELTRLLREILNSVA